MEMNGDWSLMSLAWQSLLVEVGWILQDVAEKKTHLVWKVTALGLWFRTVAIAKLGTEEDARYFVRMDHSGALYIFIAIEDVHKWRVIALWALPPSERPDGVPADFIGIIHETADNPKKLPKCRCCGFPQFGSLLAGASHRGPWHFVSEEGATDGARIVLPRHGATDEHRFLDQTHHERKSGWHNAG